MRIADPDRDERAVAVENSSYRWAYMVVTYGLLGIAAYRALALNQAPWDLIALAVAGGLVASGYQATHRTVSRKRLFIWVSSFIAAAVCAVILVSFA
jgi:hypothetical protein